MKTLLQVALDPDATVDDWKNVFNYFINTGQGLPSEKERRVLARIKRDELLREAMYRPKTEAATAILDLLSDPDPEDPQELYLAQQINELSETLPPVTFNSLIRL